MYSEGAISTRNRSGGIRAPSLSCEAILGPSRAKDKALLRHDRTGPDGRSLGGDLVHKVVVMPGIVVEQHQRLYTGRIGETHTLLPSRVAPILVLRKLR